MSRDPSDSKDEPQKPTEVIIDESSSDSDVVFVENIEGLTDPGHPSEGQTGQVTTGASASQESSEKADTPQSQSALGECPSPPTPKGVEHAPSTSASPSPSKPAPQRPASGKKPAPGQRPPTGPRPEPGQKLPKKPDLPTKPQAQEAVKKRTKKTAFKSSGREGFAKKRGAWVGISPFPRINRAPEERRSSNEGTEPPSSSSSSSSE